MNPFRDPPETLLEYRDRGYWWKIPAPILASALVGTLCYGMILGFRECARVSPRPHERCVESVEIVNGSSSQRICPLGRIEVTQASSSDGSPRAIVHCVCDRDQTADGGVR